MKNRILIVLSEVKILSLTTTENKQVINGRAIKGCVQKRNSSVFNQVSWLKQPFAIKQISI